LLTRFKKKKTANPAVKAKLKRTKSHLIKMKNQSIANNIDWISIIIYALLVILDGSTSIPRHSMEDMKTINFYCINHTFNIYCFVC
jgi:hypothetical protein